MRTARSEIICCWTTLACFRKAKQQLNVSTKTVARKQKWSLHRTQSIMSAERGLPASTNEPRKRSFGKLT